MNLRKELIHRVKAGLIIAVLGIGAIAIYEAMR